MAKKKRRGNGEGNVRQRNGSWQVSVMTGYHNGKKVVKCFSGKTRAEALAKKDAYLRERSEGLNLDHNMTFATWGVKFIEVHRARIKPVTYHNYLHILKRINQYIGDKPLASILPYDLDCMINEMIQDGFSKSTVNHAKGLTYMILNAAEVNGLVRKIVPDLFHV